MKRSNWFWGAFFLAAAIFVIASQLGAFVDIGFWSITASIALAAVIVYSIANLKFFGILVPAVLLYEIYRKPLDLYYISFWQLLLAAVLASIGLGLIFRSPRRWFKRLLRRKRVDRMLDKISNGADKKGEWRGSVSETLDGDKIFARARFTEACRYLHSEGLKKAELDVAFGQLKVYFDQATPDPAGAEVLVDVSFGEMKLYIPRSWRVIDNVTASLGAARNVEHAGEPDAPTLTISGNVSFGDLNVEYV